MPSAEEIKKLEDAIRSMEGLKAKGLLPAEQADASISVLKNQLATHQAELDGDGAVAQGTGAKAVGQDGVLIEGDVSGNLLIGAKIEKLEVIIENAKKKSLPFPEALAKYLTNIIANHQSLRLQGVIRHTLQDTLSFILRETSSFHKEFYHQAPDEAYRSYRNFPKPAILCLSRHHQCKSATDRTPFDLSCATAQPCH